MAFELSVRKLNKLTTLDNGLVIIVRAEKSFPGSNLR
jgi:hypothetical protein